jgi:hypothetical protein
MVEIHHRTIVQIANMFSRRRMNHAKANNSSKGGDACSRPRLHRPEDRCEEENTTVHGWFGAVLMLVASTIQTMQRYVDAIRVRFRFDHHSFRWAILERVILENELSNMSSHCRQSRRCKMKKT